MKMKKLAVSLIDKRDSTFIIVAQGKYKPILRSYLFFHFEIFIITSKLSPQRTDKAAV